MKRSLDDAMLLLDQEVKQLINVTLNTYKRTVHGLGVQQLPGYIQSLEAHIEQLRREEREAYYARLQCYFDGALLEAIQDAPLDFRALSPKDQAAILSVSIKVNHLSNAKGLGLGHIAVYHNRFGIACDLVERHHIASGQPSQQVSSDSMWNMPQQDQTLMITGALIEAASSSDYASEAWQKFAYLMRHARLDIEVDEQLAPFLECIQPLSETVEDTYTDLLLYRLVRSLYVTAADAQKPVIRELLILALRAGANPFERIESDEGRPALIYFVQGAARVDLMQLVLEHYVSVWISQYYVHSIKEIYTASNYAAVGNDFEQYLRAVERSIRDYLLGAPQPVQRNRRPIGLLERISKQLQQNRWYHKFADFFTRDSIFIASRFASIERILASMAEALRHEKPDEVFRGIQAQFGDIKVRIRRSRLHRVLETPVTEFLTRSVAAQAAYDEKQQVALQERAQLRRECSGFLERQQLAMKSTIDHIIRAQQAMRQEQLRANTQIARVAETVQVHDRSIEALTTRDSEKDQQIQAQRGEIQAQREEIQVLQQRDSEKDQQIQAQRGEIQAQREEIQVLQQRDSEKDRQLQTQQEQLQTQQAQLQWLINLQLGVAQSGPVPVVVAGNPSQGRRLELEASRQQQVPHLLPLGRSAGLAAAPLFSFGGHKEEDNMPLDAAASFSSGEEMQIVTAGGTAASSVLFALPASAAAAPQGRDKRRSYAAAASSERTSSRLDTSLV